MIACRPCTCFPPIPWSNNGKLVMLIGKFGVPCEEAMLEYSVPCGPITKYSKNEDNLTVE